MGRRKNHRVQLYLLSFVLCMGAAPGPEREIFRDDFREISRWKAFPSAGVALALSGGEGATGRALRLDFDFAGHAGWAAARREVAIDLPENWELDVSLRGEALANDLEIKLIDATGQNVWWAVRRDLAPPARGTALRLKKRHFSFAWGPAGGGEIPHVAALELTLAPRAGGKGWIAFHSLPVTCPPPPA